MKLEVLVATMHQIDHKLIKKMNIKTDAIITNQCERFGFEEINVNNKKIKYFSFNEQGVGLNRNNALMRAQGDICLVADDDMRYEDDYEEIVLKAFKQNPQADVIIFNLFEREVKRYKIQKTFNVNRFNYTKFGAARIAFKRESIHKNGIFFNLSFGGGAKYSAGEDTLFLHDCLQKKLKIIACPEYIATLEDDRPSTWFNGYTEKLLTDTGASYSLLFKMTFRLRCLYFCIKRYKNYKTEFTFFEALQLLHQGAREFKKNNSIQSLKESEDI